MGALTDKAIELGATLVYACDAASGSLIDLVDSNDAAASGTPIYRAAGVPGSPFAVELDGSTEYFTLGSSELNGLAAYTVEMVLRPASAGATRIIFDARDGGSDGLQMLITSANLVSANHNKKKDPF